MVSVVSACSKILVKLPKLVQQFFGETGDRVQRLGQHAALSFAASLRLKSDDFTPVSISKRSSALVRAAVAQRQCRAADQGGYADERGESDN